MRHLLPFAIDLDGGVDATADLAAQIDLGITVSGAAAPQAGCGTGGVAEVIDHIDEGDRVVVAGALHKKLRVKIGFA